MTVGEGLMALMSATVSVLCILRSRSDWGNGDKDLATFMGGCSLMFAAVTVMAVTQ